MFSLICTWINGSENNRAAGILSRHRDHYDATAMLWYNIYDTRKFVYCNWHCSRYEINYIHNCTLPLVGIIASCSNTVNVGSKLLWMQTESACRRLSVARWVSHSISCDEICFRNVQIKRNASSHCCLWTDNWQVNYLQGYGIIGFLKRGFLRCIERRGIC